ncbi:MAG: tRNA (adenosine(37)-N6)-dimethylallyltransferase MiaA [Deltaproteobacteria bacterium]
MALELARLLPVEIVSADSMQVYRGMDIGTAKPTPDERREVPHHLIDVADPDETYSAGRFVEEASRAIRGIRSRGRIPFLVGGTGLYLRALLRGLDPLPSDERVRKALRDRWEREGGAAMYERLRRTDPEAAARIRPADRLRVIRALEIAELTGEPASARRRAWRTEADPGRVLFLALRIDRGLLYRKIDGRVEAMIRAGLVDEVRDLLSRGYGPDLRSMRALGYRHLLRHLLEGRSLDEAVREMKRDTRRYAKRQQTWLSAERGVRWIEAGSPVAPLAETAKQFLF